MKVLVAIDGSKSSFNALERAIELGVLKGSDVVVLSVVSELPAPSSVSEAYQLVARESIRKELEKVQLDAVAMLQGISGSAKGLIFEGQPGTSILECAKQEKVDLIVMGTKGKSGLFGSLIGSVASYVVSHSHVPVLVVPHR